MRRLLVASLAAVAATLLLLEAGLALLVRSGRLALPGPPAAAPLLWDGAHPRFGVWHHPNVRAVQTSACFEVGYRTNSVGARDVERARESAAPRVVVLGDSIAEGWGLPARRRFSNLLERETGIPHLNFAMAHFGPYQQVLVYRELAGSYAHDFVLATVVAVNDFVDLDYETARTAAGYEHRYRPYLVPVAAPDGRTAYRHLDHREPALRRALRRHTHLFHAFALLRARLAGSERDGGYVTPAGRSYFYDASERQLALLEHSLELLADAARGKRLAVVLVPHRPDLERTARDGADPLSRRLAGWAATRGVTLVNLLPAMHAAAAASEQGPAGFEFPCDYHWNAAAHAFAAGRLRAELAGIFYPGGASAAPAPAGAAAASPPDS
jgi:hypothetical protein